jgi:hypothetical protein
MRIASVVAQIQRKKQFTTEDKSVVKTTAITTTTIKNMLLIAQSVLIAGCELALYYLLRFIEWLPVIGTLLRVSRKFYYWAYFHPIRARIFSCIILILLLTGCTYEPYQPPVVTTTDSDQISTSTNANDGSAQGFQKLIVFLLDNAINSLVPIANQTFTLMYNLSVIDFTKSPITCAAGSLFGGSGFSDGINPSQLLLVWQCGTTHVWENYVSLVAYMLGAIVALDFARNMIEGVNSEVSLKVFFNLIPKYALIIFTIFNANILMTVAFDVPMRIAAAIHGDPFSAALAIVKSLYKISGKSNPDFMVIVIGGIFGFTYMYYILRLSFLYFIRMVIAFFCFVASTLAITSYAFPETRGYFHQWRAFVVPLIVAPIIVSINYAITTEVLNVGINDLPDPYTHGVSWAIAMMFAIIMLAFTYKILSKLIGPVGEAGMSVVSRGIGVITRPVTNVMAAVGGYYTGKASDALGYVNKQGGRLVTAGAGALAGNILSRVAAASSRSNAKNSSGDSSNNTDNEQASSNSGRVQQPVATSNTVGSTGSPAVQNSTPASGNSLDMQMFFNALNSSIAQLNDNISILITVVANSSNATPTTTVVYANGGNDSGEAYTAAPGGDTTVINYAWPEVSDSPKSRLSNVATVPLRRFNQFPNINNGSSNWSPEAASVNFNNSYANNEPGSQN